MFGFSSFDGTTSSGTPFGVSLTPLSFRVLLAVLKRSPQFGPGTTPATSSCPAQPLALELQEEAQPAAGHGRFPGHHGHHLH